MLSARVFDSGFALSHDTYNGISTASDGRVYYVLCSQVIEAAGQLCSFDPATQQIRRLADLSEACGESHAVPQGKSHVSFVECGGKLYFATHIGYYSIVDGKETFGIPGPGYAPYPGGHFLSLDLATGTTEDLATAPGGEGVLTFTMDAARGVQYAILWPSGRFVRLDLATRRLEDFGPISLDGEGGRGEGYRTLCRSIAVDPRDGRAYFTVSEGTIHYYDPATGSLGTVEGDDLRKDYFGLYDVSSPGHMAYNWRQTFWHPEEDVIYGIHGNSGYLFRFDPRAGRVEVLERLTSEPSRRSGMFDQFSYGYLGFALGPNLRTIYYLTGGPIYVEGKRVKGKPSTAKGEAKGEENLHLVTYDIPGGQVRDHGPVFYADGTRPAYVNSIAVGAEGTVYTLARIPARGKERVDLIAIRP